MRRTRPANELARRCAFLLALGFGGAHAVCPPSGLERSGLDEFRKNGFAIEDDARRNALALELLDCVGNPDPALRDGLAFETIQQWLRERALAAETLLALHAGLIAQLEDRDDPRGFRRPFAALILSEVARADRLEPFLSNDARRETATLAADWLQGVRDYRGLSDDEGWRHGIAHGADLVLQLALNPQIDADATRRLMEALASQIAPPGTVYYVHGEPERLARAVHFTHRRGILDVAFWDAWLQRVSDPAPLADWREAYGSETGLARRHNTMAFLQALHFAALSADDAEGEAMAAICMAGLRRLHGA